MGDGMDLMSAYIMGNADSNCNRGGMGNIGELAELLVIAGLFGGGGWGFGGIGGGGGAMLNGMLTRADLAQSFSFNNLENAVRGVQQGICDSTYAITTNMMSGFHGVDNAVCNLGFNLQQSANEISHQISDCCCQTGRAIDGVNYNMAKGLCDLGVAINTQTRDINDTIRDGFARMEAQNNARYVADLERKLNACDRDSALQGLGTYLINTLRPSPIPAYQSCNPWAGSGGNWNGCNGCFGYAA